MHLTNLVPVLTVVACRLDAAKVASASAVECHTRAYWTVYHLAEA
jgi:hypothetical protein